MCKSREEEGLPLLESSHCSGVNLSPSKPLPVMVLLPLPMADILRVGERRGRGLGERERPADLLRISRIPTVKKTTANTRPPMRRVW